LGQGQDQDQAQGHRQAQEQGQAGETSLQGILERGQASGENFSPRLEGPQPAFRDTLRTLSHLILRRHGQRDITERFS
jgi:hypothetical protein